MLQDNPKPTAIIFGASQSGISALEKLQKDYQVVAFADNAMDKIGDMLAEIPVIAPAEISEKSIDKLFIASEFFEQIQLQLVEELALSPEVIEILPTSVIKPISLGESEAVLQTAESILFLVCDALTQKKVPFHIDAGTLLGVYRDGGLIPWDDDLDIAVSSDYVELAQAALESILSVLKQETGAPWEVHVHLANQSFGAVREGDIRGIKLKCANEQAKLPMLDIFFKYIAGETMDYVLSSRGLTMPSYHLKSTVMHPFKNKLLPIPTDVESYLTRHYGDWRTPVKDWNLGMLKNATVFE